MGSVGNEKLLLLNTKSDREEILDVEFKKYVRHLCGAV